MQGRVEGAFADLEHIAGHRAQTLSEAIAVKGSDRKRFEDEEIERAGQQLGSGFVSHRLS